MIIDSSSTSYIPIDLLHPRLSLRQRCLNLITLKYTPYYIDSASFDL